MSWQTGTDDLVRLPWRFTRRAFCGLGAEQPRCGRYTPGFRAEFLRIRQSEVLGATSGEDFKPSILAQTVEFAGQACNTRESRDRANPGNYRELT